MALIHCPECGKEISSASLNCIHCGCSLKLYSKNKMKKRFVCVFVLFLFVFSLFFVYQKIHEKNLTEIYIENLREVSYIMLDGAAEAEHCGNLIIQVWNNSIYKKSDEKTDKYTKNENGIFYEDFNDALNSLFDNSKFLDDLDKIQENQSEVLIMMKDLQNVPKGYEEEARHLNNYYEEYMIFTNMVINPLGSLNSFSDEFTDSDKKLSQYYNKIRLYIN